MKNGLQMPMQAGGKLYTVPITESFFLTLNVLNIVVLNLLTSMFTKSLDSINNELKPWYSAHPTPIK